MKTWVERQIKDFIRSNGNGEVLEQSLLYNFPKTTINSLHISIRPAKNVVSITGVGRKNSGRYGEAVCSINDGFDAKKGFAMAWARYKGEAIPQAVLLDKKPLGSLSRGTRIRISTGIYYVITKQNFQDYTIIETQSGWIERHPNDMLVEVLPLD